MPALDVCYRYDSTACMLVGRSTHTCFNAGPRGPQMGSITLPSPDGQLCRHSPVKQTPLTAAWKLPRPWRPSYRAWRPTIKLGRLRASLSPHRKSCNQRTKSEPDGATVPTTTRTLEDGRQPRRHSARALSLPTPRCDACPSSARRWRRHRSRSATYLGQMQCNEMHYNII